MASSEGVPVVLIVSTLWWLFFWTAVGLCAGSFLNVIIYRLPREQSLRNPLWSACPCCGHRIRWYDNLPIISFILLKGRCRDCRAAIPTRYLVVEASMALVVLMLLDAFFIAHVRHGLMGDELGLTEQLVVDWPIFLAHIILFAALFSMSVIDLEHYWVDVRFTNLATLAGFVLHALWTPRHDTSWVRPLDTTSVMSLLVVAGLGIVWIVMICQPHVDPEDFGEPEAEPEPEPPPELEASSGAVPAGASRLDAPRTLGWMAGLMLLAVLVAIFVAKVDGSAGWHWLRAVLPLLLFFLFILAESSVEREADHEIIEAIDEERYHARRMVLGEFALLVPALLCAWFGYHLMSGDGEVPTRISEVLHARVRVGGISMMRHWEPLYGLATAATGYVIAGGLGWAVRIVFTFVFGKEAFGAGDIHLLAAAGCVASWPVAVLGFFLTCLLGLVGWLISLKFKRTRAIPLGPWLSLSLLALVIFYQPVVESRAIARMVDAVRGLFF